MVDTIFADVAQPDQARIVAINASYFLKSGGHFVISIKVGFFLRLMKSLGMGFSTRGTCGSMSPLVNFL